jgi:hypothetical protein
MSLLGTCKMTGYIRWFSESWVGSGLSEIHGAVSVT